ncbi:MAG: hypothetical protein UC771_09725 [Faecalibacterium sp.]|nr:hypothetical protein [Faecalibacterium sp.]
MEDEIRNHRLTDMVLDQSTKAVGFVTENIMVRKARQDGFEKFIVVKR